LVTGTDWVVVDFTGAPPGWWAIDLVRESSSPSLILVLVIDLLQVPPSWAFALAWSLSMLSFSITLLLLVALPPSEVAALPAPPMLDEVPAGPVDVPPNPMVEAEVPPAAALPAVPTVPLEPVEEPAPMVEALGAGVVALGAVVLCCAKAWGAANTTAASARGIIFFMVFSPWIFYSVRRYTVQLPLESVTVVVFPSDAELVEKLPLPPPEWVMVPPGPVVVPLTWPPPAVIDVDMLVLAPGGLSPFLSSTVLQFLLSDEVELLVEPVLLLELELLELLVCADAAAMPAAVTARNATNAFTGDLLENWAEKRKLRGPEAAQLRLRY